MLKLTNRKIRIISFSIDRPIRVNFSLTQSGDAVDSRSGWPV